MGKKTQKENINFRFNMATLIVYLIGTVLIIQLFNLQIVKGEDYRTQSNTRLSRKSTLEATRGSIVDKTGNVLATSKMGFSIELYKTKIDPNTLNRTILELVTLLEKYGKTYVDSFPIKINPFEFTIQGEELQKWKEKNKLKDNATAEECFFKFKEKYEIENIDIQEVRKIIAIRYEIVQKGYSSTKPITISQDVNREIVAELSERNTDFPGISIVTEPIRKYTSGNLASHIIGYVGKIREEEYENQKEIYNNDDTVGRTGIEYVFEDYLRGKRRKKTNRYGG